MANLQKLAVLINDLGGYDVASDALGIDENILHYAVEGNALDRIQDAQLTSAYANLELDNEIQNEYGIDFDNIDTVADDLQTLEFFTGDIERANDIRELVADGKIDLDDVQSNYGLFADLNERHQDKLIEFIKDGGDAREFFEAYENDGDIWDIEDSDFWEWYRDTFYSD